MSQLLRNVLVMVPVFLLWETEQRSLFTKTRTELRNSKTTNSYEIFYLKNACMGTYLLSTSVSETVLTDRGPDVGNWLC